MDSNNTSSRLDVVARITQITMALSVIVGIFVALYGLYDTKRQADLSLKTLRMAQLGTLQEMVKKGREIHEQHVDAFLKRKAGAESEVVIDLDSIETLRCVDRATDGEGQLLPAEKVLENYDWIGRNVYYDSCFEDFRKIGDHYEELGAMVRLGYVDFDFVFTLVAFPDRFWDETRDYHNLIKDHWKGRHKPLPDVWSNFSWLRDEYQKARRVQRDQP